MSGTLGPRVPVTPQVNDGTDLTSLLNPQPQTTGGINLPPIGSAASTQSVTTTPNVQQVKTPSSGQTPSPPTTPVPTQQVSSQQAQATAAALLQPGGGLQNPLNSYYQVQPVFKLFMTQDIDPFSAASSSATANPNGSSVPNNTQKTSTSPSPSASPTTPTTTTQIYAALDKMQQVVLAQTGVTGYNIKSVEMESMVGPSDYARMVNETKMTITITEAMGVGFQEAILAGAMQLGIKNHIKSFFYLDLHFIAYDQSGNVVTNPVSALGLENRWVWQVAIVDIDVHLDAGGGTYTLSVIPFTEAAYDPDVFMVPDTLRTAGGTLGAFTNNLAANLNSSWQARYGNTVTQYKFVWHSLSETLQGTFASGFNDPSQYATTFTSGDFSSIEGLSFDVLAGGTPNFTFQNGMTIAKFVEAVIMNTETAAKLAKDDPSIGQVPGTTPGFRKSIIWRIEPDIQLTAFETYTQQYYKIITYHIRPYYTQLPIIDNDQAKQAAQPGVAFQALQDVVKQNLIQKRYDYIYTGLNIDVIDFDIHYNFQWNAIISKFAGKLTNSDMLKPAARLAQAGPTVNVGVAAQQAQPQLQQNQVSTSQLQQQFNLAQSGVSNAQGNIAGLQQQIQQQGGTATPTQQTNLTQAQSQLSTANSNLATAQQQYSQRLQSISVPLSSVITGSGVTYAEALIAQPAPSTTSSVNPISPTQVSTVQAFRDADDNAGSGTTQANTIDKSVFSAIMGQMYLPVASQFFNIEIGIRGDPFWLGQTNLIRIAMMRNAGSANSSKTVPDWFVGDNHFLMHFRAPIGYGNDFAPDFRDSLVFNGIYKVHNVKSIFGGNDGFKQELQGYRMMCINTADAATNQGTPANTNPATDHNNMPAPGSSHTATANPNPGTTGASTDWYNSPQAAPYKSTIDSAAAQYNVPPQLLAWQIGQESSFNAGATNSYVTSSGQPVGIAQFTTGTAQYVPGYGPLDPTDPNASINAAAAYDQHLYQQTGSWQGALTKYGTLSGNPSQSTWNGYNNAIAQSNLPPGS
jgi:hypothetical protein